MPFGGRSPGGAGEGVELARGFISISARYSPAMQQVAKDFRMLEDEAAATGVRAGKNISSGVRESVEGTGGLTYHLRNAFRETGRTFESDAQMYGTLAGRAITKGISAPFVLAGREAKKFGESAMETVTGPMAKMIGATTVIGGLFETLKKGWELDSDIQQTTTAMKAFGASTQDVQGFLDAVNDSIKGTSNSFSDVAEQARVLFYEGLRGNKLSDELLNVQNIATGLKAPLETIMRLRDQAIGRDVINPLMLGKFQAAGIPARQELLRHFNLPENEQGNAALDKMLGDKKSPITFDTLYQQMTQDFKGQTAAYSQTMPGQMKLLETNIGKLGGGLMEPLFGTSAGPLGKINEWFDKVSSGTGLKTLGGDIGKGAGDFGTILTSLMRTGSAIATGGGEKQGGIDWSSAQHGFDNFQHAMDNVKHALDNVVHAADNVHHALENVWHAGENVVHALENVWHAGENTWHALENVWHAGENVWHALENIWHAADKVISFFTNLPELAAGAVRNLFSGIHLPSWLGGHATGAIVESHAKGAMIQPAVHPNGIVQWAEPSTGGEAYIPLGLSNRSRSMAIWKETGRRLRAFADGAVTPGGMSGAYAPNIKWGPHRDDNNVHPIPRQGDWSPDQSIIGAIPGWTEQPPKRYDPATGKWVPRWPMTFAKGGITGGIKLFDQGGINDDFGASAGAPTIGPPNENEIRSWVEQQFGIPNTTGTGSWENAAHNHDGGWHHRGLGGKDVKSGYAFDFHGTPSQMSALANWVASNYAKDTLELIYSGAGFDHNREIKNGRFGDVYGPGTNAQHTDHVHWAMTQAPGGKDGVVPVDISKVGGASLGGSKGGGSGGGGMTGGLFESLGKIADGGIKESLLPPGFADYSQNSWVKSGKAGLGMLLGMAGVGDGSGDLGGMFGGLGGDMMHPLRGALAQADPARAEALGWTQPGDGSTARGHGRISPGQLAFNGGMAAPGGGGITVNGSVIDQGGVDRLNKMQQDKKVTDSRAGHSSGVSQQRLGQPGG